VKLNFRQTKLYNDLFLFELKHIIEAYLNAAIHCSSTTNDITEISKSFTEVDLRNIEILTIARMVQQTILINILDQHKSSFVRSQNQTASVLFQKNVGGLIGMIENHSIKMKSKPIIFSKDNNYLVDKLKSQKFKEFIFENARFVTQGF